MSKNISSILTQVALVFLAGYITYLFKEAPSIAIIGVAIVCFTVILIHFDIPEKIKRWIENKKINQEISLLYPNFKELVKEFQYLLFGQNYSLFNLISGISKFSPKFGSKCDILKGWYEYFLRKEVYVKRKTVDKEAFYISLEEFTMILKYYEKIIEDELLDQKGREIPEEIKKYYLEYKERHSQYCLKFENFIKQVNEKLRFWIEYKPKLTLPEKLE